MKIKAGPKLDQAVAEAIGLKSGVLVDSQERYWITSREWDEICVVEHSTCEGGLAIVPFEPSTDLNAAFAAAEKVGLFEGGHFIVRKQCDANRWCCGDECSGSYADTPALAICAAILKLKTPVTFKGVPIIFKDTLGEPTGDI